MPSIAQIKKQFDVFCRVKQECRVNVLDQIFYQSNDQVTYWDIPKNVRDRHKKNVIDYLAEHAELKPVNLMVAESDYMSWSMEDIPGDVIIMDNNKKLLDYIEHLHMFLIKQYELYKSSRTTFLKVKEAFNKFFFEANINLPLFLKNRMSAMGARHWLYNEENYIKSMESLLKRNIITLNIDLFNLGETAIFSHLLEKNNFIATYVNLTNLPDYDRNDTLSKFLNVIPVADEPDAQLFQWNIHDHGFAKSAGHIYHHFLWYSNNVKDYISCFNEIMPACFALQDFYDLLKRKLMIPGINDALERNQVSRLIKNYERLQDWTVHNIDQKALRDNYFVELKVVEVKFDHFCRRLDNCAKELAILAQEFAESIKLDLNAQIVFNVEQAHWKLLQEISSLAQQRAIKLDGLVFDLLKFDAELAKSVHTIFSINKRNENFTRLLELTILENIVRILNPPTDSPSAEAVKQRVEEYLTDMKGEKCVASIKKAIAQLSSFEQINELRRWLGPLLVVTQSNEKLSLFYNESIPFQPATSEGDVQEKRCVIM